MKGRRVFFLALWMAGIVSAIANAQNADGSLQKVRAATIWRTAEVEGRLLWVSEQLVLFPLDARTELQAGWQRFVAKGRVRTNRFSTSARWFGAERILREEADSRLVLSARRLEGSEGVADVAEGVFTYVAPRIDTFSLISLQRASGRTTGYRLSYSRVHAGTEAADTIAVKASAEFLLAKRWQVQLEGGVYADRHGETTYRPVLSGAVGFELGRRIRAQLSATVAPRGFPFAGTPIEALTAFALYQPGGLVESWHDRSAGYLSLQITAGW